MSVNATKLTSEPVGKRHGYRLEANEDEFVYTESDSQSINLEVWEEGYNVEWRTDTDLDAFVTALDRIEDVEGAEAVAWFGSTEVEPYSEDSTYPAVTDLEDFPDLCGNLRIESNEFEMYWEDTRGENTVELTSYRDDFDLFESLYEATVPETDRIDTDAAVQQIQAIIDDRR